MNAPRNITITARSPCHLDWNIARDRSIIPNNI